LGKWADKSWTVKVDADAVFVPTLLQGWLSSNTGESPHGVYFENCKNAQHGFFGSLEVMSDEMRQPHNWRIAIQSTPPAPTMAVIGSMAPGERMFMCRGAWTGTTSTRLKPST